MRRRDFIKGAALFAAGAGAGLGLSAMPRSARAFGEAPRGVEDALIPPDLQAQNLLEVFLFGGLSQYETFYNVLSHGQSTGTHWHLFLKSGEVDTAMEACGFSGASLVEPFGEDALGQQVNFGPFVMPLRSRPDLLDRTRVAITSHAFAPHEAAIPFSLCGHPLGNPNMAGLGTHVQRHFREREGGLDRAPYAYVLLPPSAIVGELARGALAVGAHPSTARPLAIKINAAGDLAQLLERPNLGADRDAYDALVRGQIDRYADRLRRRDGQMLRARHLADVTAAAGAIAGVELLQQTLEPTFFEPLPGTSCGGSVPADSTRMSLRLATHLLNHPTSAARYVCVVDGGFAPSKDAGGYDTHENCAAGTAQNLTHTLAALAELINKPGESDPNKLDLDRTMIVLTTEFGRTPHEEGEKGRGHWPGGYPVVFLGGPIRKSSRGIFGACGEDGLARQFSTATENRIALLLALGIWPFDQEGFAVSHVRGAASEHNAASIIRANLLGLA